MSIGTTSDTCISRWVACDQSTITVGDPNYSSRHVVVKRRTFN